MSTSNSIFDKYIIKDYGAPDEIRKIMSKLRCSNPYCHAHENADNITDANISAMIAFYIGTGSIGFKTTAKVCCAPFRQQLQDAWNKIAEDCNSKGEI